MPDSPLFPASLQTEAAIRVEACGAGEVETIAATEPAGREYARRTYRRQVEGRCLYLVAWAGAVPVGSGELQWSTPPELTNLHVRAAFRGLGIGSKIVAAAEEPCPGHRDPHRRCGGQPCRRQALRASRVRAFRRDSYGFVLVRR